MVEAMVYLDRIYTKSGDAGETSLGDGTRVRKTHQRIAAFGAVDEVNAVLGVVIALGNLASDMQARLRHIQNDLFDLGADLCIPEREGKQDFEPLRMTADQVQQLEHWIDAETEELEPLRSFILPGGTPAAALLHQARTVCRRSETTVYHLAETEPVNVHATTYLNRLSDLLFVMARIANDQGRSDIAWVPGEHRQTD